jgi:ABC-type dipeptide/oligopeptide/nickel transport system permease subunit
LDGPGGARGFWPEAARVFRKDRWALAGLVVVGIAVLVALAGVTPYPPNLQLPEGISLLGLPLPPDSHHWLGTDFLGRDVLSRLIAGARVSLAVGFGGAALATIVGVLIGLLAGYYGSAVDTLLMRFTDVMMAFPFLLLVVALVAVLGSGLGNLFLAIGLVTWVNAARIVRASTLSLRTLDYLEAARALGGSDAQILLRHVLPNLLGTVMVLFTAGVSYTILLESALSFLGLGAPPPAASWGSMVRDAQTYYQVAPWLMLAPGLAIVLTVVGFNLVAEGLRDAFDPVLRTR